MERKKRSMEKLLRKSGYFVLPILYLVINKDLEMQRQAKISDKNRRFGVFMTPFSRRSKITEFAARCNNKLQGSKFIFGFGSTCATRCKFLGALPKF